MPAGMFLLDILRGRLYFRNYWKSVLNFHTEAVFNREDPVPGLVEFALIPYLR